MRKQRISSVWIVPTTFLLAACTAAAARVRADDAVAIQRTFTAGAVNNYKVTVKALVNSPALGPQDVDLVLKLALTETTRPIQPDGGTKLGYKVKDVALTMGGNDFPVQIAAPEVEQAIDRLGHTTAVNYQTSDSAFGQYIAELMRTVLQAEDLFFPANPVKVGDSWKIDNSRRIASGQVISWIGDANVAGKETVEGQDALKVHIAVDGSGTTTTKPHLDATALVSVKDGRVLKIQGVSTSLNPEIKTADISLVHDAGGSKDAKLPAGTITVPAQH